MTYKISDFLDPWDSVLEFETEVAKFTGAPYCISTDNCSHAIKISFLLAHNNSNIRFPCRTYLSVLMVMHELNIPYELTETDWRKEYQFENTNIWDSARRFEENMFKPGNIQCLSFGNTKPLQIGRGGCILTDNEELYIEASKMRSDGRDLFNFKPWADQKKFRLGFHYYMRPEECITGLNMLKNKEFNYNQEKFYNYPDCRLLTIER